jgi:hypothetical protein
MAMRLSDLASQRIRQRPKRAVMHMRAVTYMSADMWQLWPSICSPKEFIMPLILPYGINRKIPAGK